MVTSLELMKMQLTIPIQFDEDKLREIVEEAVARLKAEGYIWRDSPQPYDWSKHDEQLLGRQNGSSPKQAD